MRTAFSFFTVPALSVALAAAAGPAANPGTPAAPMGSSVGTQTVASAAAREANKAAYRALIEACLNKGDLTVADKYIAKDMIDHDPMNRMGGLEGFKKSIADWRSAFPDGRVEVQDIIAEGDRVMARLRTTGTHKGSMNGVAATNKKIDVLGFDEVLFRNGKAAEHWGVIDQLGMMKQLGIIPDGPPQQQPSSAPAGDRPAPPSNKY
jgi:predicted ester cyclase